MTHATRSAAEQAEYAAEFRTDPPLSLARMQHVNEQRMVRWHHGGKRDWSVLEWAGAMCGEAGEAANVAKKMLRIELDLPGNESSEHRETEYEALRAKLANEIADVLLYATLLASSVNIDVERAVAAKFNAKSVEQGFPERL